MGKFSDIHIEMMENMAIRNIDPTSKNIDVWWNEYAIRNKMKPAYYLHLDKKDGELYEFYLEILKYGKDRYTDINTILDNSKIPRIRKKFSKFISVLKSMGLLECKDSTFHSRYKKEYIAYSQDIPRNPPQRPFIMYPPEGKNMSKPTVDDIAQEAFQVARDFAADEPIEEDSFEDLLNQIMDVLNKLELQRDALLKTNCNPKELSLLQLNALMHNKLSETHE